MLVIKFGSTQLQNHEIAGEKECHRRYKVNVKRVCRTGVLEKSGGQQPKENECRIKREREEEKERRVEF